MADVDEPDTESQVTRAPGTWFVSYARSVSDALALQHRVLRSRPPRRQTPVNFGVLSPPCESEGLLRYGTDGLYPPSYRDHGTDECGLPALLTRDG